jgi:DNA polymerase-1
MYLENKVLEAFSEMEYNGMYLNATYWHEEIITPLEAQIKQLETDLDKELIRLLPQFEVSRSKDLFGSEGILTHKTRKKTQFNDRYTQVNWNSSQQKIDIFHLLNIDTTASTGSDSVGDEILQRNKSHPLVALLIDYSECSKLLSSFGESLIKKIHPDTHRIHPEFKQLGTATGRVSCTNPNLQQIPSGVKFRKGFQAPSDYQITATDYSGMELRILADLSGDPTFIEAFNNGEDLHSKIASKMFNVEVSKKVNKHLRDRQKTISFGLSYGATEHKFKDMFDGDVEKAKEVLGLFFSMFPSIKAYLDSSGKSAVDHLYSVTPPPYNRRRWYPKLRYADAYELHKIKAEVEREGKNAVIQGCNADITKAALYKIHRYIIDNNLDAKLICTVHDEILVEHHKDIDMRPIMEGIMIQEAEVVLKRVKVEAESSTDYYWVH